MDLQMVGTIEETRLNTIWIIYRAKGKLGQKHWACGYMYLGVYSI